MMSMVVGIFDDYSDALQARARLVEAGIEAESLQISPRRGGEEGAERDSKSDHRGFFARLFGLGRDEEKTGHYAEAVRRGGVALTVSLEEDDDRADEISDILNECGAIDVDERVERWKAAGYTGFDPSAPIYTDEDVRRERESFRANDVDTRIYRGPERRVGSTQPYTGPERRA